MRAVIIGAGNIGRGFAGRLAHAAGARISFIDNNAAFAKKLAESPSYTVTMYGGAGGKAVVTNYDAFADTDPSALDALCDKDAYACVSVFAGAMPGVAELLARAAEKRAAAGHPTLNILLLINHASPAKAIQELLCAKNADAAQGVALIECVVMCVAGAPTPELLSADALACANNGFSELPCDASAVAGPPPQIAGLRLAKDFKAEKLRKLYTLNTLHAVLAYEGIAAGFSLAYDAMKDVSVRARAEKALAEAAVGLCGAFGFTLEEMAAWNARMFELNDSRELSDTLSRLGADVPRKLSPDERLTGAAKLCLSHGGTPAALAHVIAMAEPDMEKIKAYTGLGEGDALLGLIRAARG